MSTPLDETMPEAVRDELDGLSSALDVAIPAKVLDRNLLIATWNIRSFGAYNPVWVGDLRATPKRDRQSLHVIAEIIRRFDVIAIQEVKSDTSSLRAVYEILGSHWSLILSDVTEGGLGNNERLAFLFDTRRVKLSGLACEVVIPPEHLGRPEAAHLERQFARSPYAVGFSASGHTVTLVSLHVVWGKSTRERVSELAAVAEWLARWSRDKNAWDHNLITLGDFNIERRGDVFHAAFTSTGLTIAPDLLDARRSVFAQDRAQAAYDQIAWFDDAKTSRPLTLPFLRGGSFDFTAAGLPSRDLSASQLSWRLSDHLPLWAEFSVRDD
ncbi:MAG TPA: endonuclease/exonuclease/phosphatase family protein [Microlunatus sp.]